MAKIKPLADENRLPLSDMIPLDTPFSAYIFPTNFCNFKCNYCVQSLGKKGMTEKFGIEPQSMNMETFRLAASQLKDFPRKLKTVNLTGHGEPLVNPLLPDMIDYLKRQNVTERIEFITNASLLTPELSLKLIDAGLDLIRISLQGLSSEKYREVCGYKLNFDAFVGQIRWFYEHRKQCKVYVKIMDLALNKDEESKFYQMFDDISDRMFVEQCRPVYNGVEATDHINISSDRYGRTHAPRVVCPLCFFMLGVFPNGDISPCETIYKPAFLGNVHDITLSEAWSGPEMREFQQMQLRGERYKHARCSKCCAPDDVSHPEDELDVSAKQIYERLTINGE